jgi:hypothetical protein
MPPRRFREGIAPWRWGIFCRAPCAKLLGETSPHYEAMNAIYLALKSTGFRETYWQVVYPGQVGGLIKIPRGTLIEFHVRFFRNGLIYGEMELGRSALLHFVNRRIYYINGYLERKLRTRISGEHAAFLRESTRRYKSLYVSNRPEWTSRNRFVTPTMKKQIRFLTVLSDWRFLAFIMLFSLISTFANGPSTLALLTASMIVVYVLAPRRS